MLFDALNIFFEPHAKNAIPRGKMASEAPGRSGQDWTFAKWGGTPIPKY
jgi:hypothetical protein